MRLGRIEFKLSYVVDLDNESMIDHAKTSLFEDVEQMVLKQSENFNSHCIELPDSELKNSDIPEFLREEISCPNCDSTDILNKLKYNSNELRSFCNECQLFFDE